MLMDKKKAIDLFHAKKCEHNYIEDYIDNMFPYKEGILIIYCNKCGLEKGYIQKLIKPKCN